MEDDYPYKNVYSLSAAEEHQVAQDIPASQATSYQTANDMAHGAFTDSLVKALGLLNTAENTSASLTALRSETLRIMRKRGFLSTPSLLPEQRDSNVSVAIQVFFGNRSSIK